MSQRFEVRMFTADGDISRSFEVECADLLEASAHAREAGEEAVFIRALASEPIAVSPAPVEFAQLR